MGRPKHLLADADNVTWLERTVKLVSSYVDGVALSGAGEVPESLSSIVRLQDVDGIVGPLTGILSAFRYKPDASWLLLACDMPCITGDAIAWLLSLQQEGAWGYVPALSSNGRVEPLFARYEPESAELFEHMRSESILRISRITDFEKVQVISVPSVLQNAWKNVNTPEDLSMLNV